MRASWCKPWIKGRKVLNNMVLRKLSHKLRMAVSSFFVRRLPGVDNMLFAGVQSSRQLCLHIGRSEFRNILVVTDRALVDLGIVEKATNALAECGLAVFVYDGVLPDPSFQIVSEGLQMLKEHRCDAVMAIGGGSSIDAAKVIAMAATNAGEPENYVGYGKARIKPLPLFAIATTSGTGSEATTGAVISDTASHEKAIIADPKLLPLAVALDPELLAGLPPPVTAATGMDALTHAIEAYIGVWAHGNSEDHARLATKLIFKYLPLAYENGSDLAAREAMAYASYCAGLAINKVNVGNVHAISHQLGAHYGIPHGLANACILPHVLEYSLPAAENRLADLARLLELGSAGDSDRVLAEQFVGAVAELCKRIGIPAGLPQVKQDDIQSMAVAALKEADSYPVPRLMDEKACGDIIRKLIL